VRLGHRREGKAPTHITSVLADDAYIQRSRSTRLPSGSKLLTFTFGSVREAVTNAGSHGPPHVIDISAQHVENHLFVQVSDDGIGFDVEAASTLSHDHYGILGMHELAEMIRCRAS